MFFFLLSSLLATNVLRAQHNVMWSLMGGVLTHTSEQCTWSAVTSNARGDHSACGRRSEYS